MFPHRSHRTTLAAILIILPLAAMAHPHMSLTSTCEFVWKGSALSGAFLDWAFDAYFSADIIRGYDANKDGRFDKAETQAVYDHAFQNLKNYYYFTFIRQGDARSNPKAVSQFSIYQKSGTVHYRFFIDLSVYKGDVWIAVYDYTYFCAIDYGATPVAFDCDKSLVAPSYSIAENKKYPVYYNPAGAASDNTIYYTWKQGLITYYPREIHLSWQNAR
jgi:ABC-type uncharacterized transport system substrate-binding protein